MDAPRLFISMGTPYTELQTKFRDELENFLRDNCGVNPRIIGKNEYPDGSPLAKIKEVMSGCHGVVIVAYERKYLQDGAEKRGGDSEKPLANKVYTTPWNHIESALAFALNLPLYIICQKNLTEEGLIEAKIDWYVQYVDIDPAEFSKVNVRESLRSWVNERVLPHAHKPTVLTGLIGRLKMSELTLEQIGLIWGTLAAVFFFGVGVGHLLPNIHGG